MKKPANVIGLILLAIVVLVVFFAVSGHRSSSSTTPASTPGTSSEKPATPKPTTTNSSSVTINNFAFSPTTLTVKAGTTITWTNHDSTSHTVVETDTQDGPKSGTLGNGESYSFTFKAAGTYKYHCSIHPDMTATVVVTD